jgi:hypothetical protein
LVIDEVAGSGLGAGGWELAASGVEFVELSLALSVTISVLESSPLMGVQLARLATAIEKTTSRSGGRIAG